MITANIFFSKFLDAMMLKYFIACFDPVCNGIFGDLSTYFKKLAYIIEIHLTILFHIYRIFQTLSNAVSNLDFTCHNLYATEKIKDKIFKARYKWYNGINVIIWLRALIFRQTYISYIGLIISFFFHSKTKKTNLM